MRTPEQQAILDDIDEELAPRPGESEEETDRRVDLVLSDPEVIAKMLAAATEARPKSEEEKRREVEAETARMTRVVQELRSMGVRKETVQKLVDAGVAGLAHVLEMTNEEIASIEGIGSETAGRIRAAAAGAWSEWNRRDANAASAAVAGRETGNHEAAPSAGYRATSESPTGARIDWAPIAWRVATSLVEVRVLRQDGSYNANRGVVVGPATVVTGMAILDSMAGSAPIVRHGRRSWKASVLGWRTQWMTCLFGVKDLPLPPAPVRWSRTLREGEYVVAFGGSGDPAGFRHGSIEALNLATESRRERPYERAFLSLCYFHPEPPPRGWVVLDSQGRLVGLVDAQLGANLSIVLPGEWALGLADTGVLMLMVEQGQHAEAVELFTRQERWSDPRVYCAAAIAYQELGNLDSAISALRQAASLEPDNPWTHRTLGSALSRVGRTHEGALESAMAGALETDPSNGPWESGEE